MTAQQLDDPAAEWLGGVLDGGQPVLADQVRALAASDGFGWQSVRRAQRALGVRCVHVNGLPYLQLAQPRHRWSA